jgi:hypothetical protein
MRKVTKERMKNKIKTLIFSLLLLGCTGTDVEEKNDSPVDTTGYVLINQSLNMSKESLIQIIEDLKWNWEKHLSGIHFSDGSFKKFDYTMEIDQIDGLLIKHTTIQYRAESVWSRKYFELSFEGKKEKEVPDTLNKCEENQIEIGKKDNCGYKILEYGSILDSAASQVAETDSSWLIGVTFKNTLWQFYSIDQENNIYSFNRLALDLKTQ